MEQELKPCPFCDCQFIRLYDDELSMKNWVECTECRAATRFVEGSPSEAIEAWNRRASGWISVSERLPEAMESVLVQMKDGEMKVAYRAKRFIGNSVAVRTDWLLGNPNDVVVAWQPLPKPYEAHNG